MAGVRSQIETYLLPPLANISHGYFEEPFPNIKAFLQNNMGRYGPEGGHKLDGEARFLYESMEPYGLDFIRWDTVENQIPDFLEWTPEDDALRRRLLEQINENLLKISNLPVWAEQELKISPEDWYLKDNRFNLVVGLEKAFVGDYRLWHPRDPEMEAAWVTDYEGWQATL